jgi:hypothetical protein
VALLSTVPATWRLIHFGTPGDQDRHRHDWGCASVRSISWPCEDSQTSQKDVGATRQKRIDHEKSPLVVKRGKFDQRRLTGDIYMSLHGVGQAVDVVVVTAEQVERHRDTHWLVIAPALREGREVYHS